MKILIVEDQENLAKLIQSGLESEGFVAEYVLDGEFAEIRIECDYETLDLIILDIMLPGINGLEVCRYCRAKNITTPILILTAKDSQEDIVSGLNAGADDYLVKPFSFEVLLARIRAILRRPTNILPAILRVKNIVLDPGSKIVFKNRTEIKLTLKEFCILEYLMRHPNQVIHRDQLVANIWDFSNEAFSNFIDVHITNLRKKLDIKKENIIETINGLGYKMNN